MRLRHAEYAGPIEALKGERALLKWPERPEEFDFIEVQFDRLGLENDGVDLSHGWHTFKLSEFVVWER